MTLTFRGIEISGIRDPALRSVIVKRVGAVLKPLQGKPLAAQVTFFDDDGPKGGPAVRCALTVRVPYRPTVRVEHTAQSPRLAFDATFKSLERQLERYRERDRDSRRHPKKYYVAKRLLEGKGGSEAG
ncbi:MAG TPA: HPF/RaiA family ribosome-associated protein [Candidatus Methylomirabilis sp.]|nr:HPF/RaiA family ribosome-associated protein [Candidatus Methylomirabilis sp.]